MKKCCALFPALLLAQRTRLLALIQYFLIMALNSLNFVEHPEGFFGINCATIQRLVQNWSRWFLQTERLHEPLQPVNRRSELEIFKFLIRRDRLTFCLRSSILRMSSFFLFFSFFVSGKRDPSEETEVARRKKQGTPNSEHAITWAPVPRNRATVPGRMSICHPRWKIYPFSDL